MDDASGPATEAHECDLCGETFDSERALRRHVRRIGQVN